MAQQIVPKLGVLYAHRVDYGIHINWTEDYEGVKRTHARIAQTIKCIKQVQCQKSACEILKKTLTELGRKKEAYGQDIDNVYDVNARKIAQIFDQIDQAKHISKDEIVKILKHGEWEYQKITIYKFHEIYASKFKPFKFQRDPNNSHTDELVEYIRKNYHSANLYIPPIVCVLDETDGKYDIIDGSHRCAAFLKINRDEPAAECEISFNFMDTPLTNEEKVDLFKSINQAKPMPELYIRDNYLESIHNFIKNDMISKFGPTCIHAVQTGDPSSSISYAKIQRSMQKEAIIKLIKTERCKGLRDEEFSDVLLSLNRQIYFLAACIFGGQIFEPIVKLNTLPSEQWKDFAKVLGYLNNNTRYRVSVLKNIMQKIKNNYMRYSVQCGRKVKKYGEPFLLGLLPDVEDLTQASLTAVEKIGLMGYE